VLDESPKQELSFMPENVQQQADHQALLAA